MIDLTGKNFGKLTVKDLAKTEDRARIWNCLCECGVVIQRATAQLNRSEKLGFVQSCRTCAQRNNKAKDLGESSWRILFNNYVGGARRRNLDFKITFNEFQEICSKDCHYCESKPIKHNRYIREDGRLVSKISSFTADRSWIQWNGIDRKNNSVGYIVENCLPCCSFCNVMKGTLDYYDFIARCGTIYLVNKISKGSK